jgi:hypothetical protein
MTPPADRSSSFSADTLLAESAWLRRLALRLVADAARADDAVQDTLVAALEREPAGARPGRAWLAAVPGELSGSVAAREATHLSAEPGSSLAQLRPIPGARAAAGRRAVGRAAARSTMHDEMPNEQEAEPVPPSVAEIAHRVRDLINEPRTHALLRRDEASFNVLCSCLDVIEDTQQGIDCYPVGSDERESGPLYVMLYGILQLLYVQQDALANMASSLGLKYQRDRLLSEVRDVRNTSVGHPTKTFKGSSHFIVRVSMSPRGFDLMTQLSGDRAPRFESVSIPELLQKQSRVVRETLFKIADHLAERDRQHRVLHMEKKLADVFPETLSYYFQKVFEATQRPELHQLGKKHVDLILETLGKFKKALADRDELEAHYGVTNTLDEVEWPLQRLRAYFAGEEGDLVDRSAYIFTTFCKGRVEELRQMAAEIDEEYASPA